MQRHDRSVPAMDGLPMKKTDQLPQRNRQASVPPFSFMGLDLVEWGQVSRAESVKAKGELSCFVMYVHMSTVNRTCTCSMYVNRVSLTCRDTCICMYIHVYIHT